MLSAFIIIYILPVVVTGIIVSFIDRIKLLIKRDKIKEERRKNKILKEKVIKINQKYFDIDIK